MDKEEFEKENQQLAALVECAEDALIGFDLNRRITVWNKGAEHLYGYSAQEMIGAPSFLLIPPELKDEEWLMLVRAIQGGQGMRYKTTRLRKDGSRIMVAITLSVIHDAGGKIAGIASVARDIIEVKRTEETLKESEENFICFSSGQPTGISFSTTAVSSTVIRQPCGSWASQSKTSSSASDPLTSHQRSNLTMSPRSPRRSG